jgi:folate-binding protein YgfZ
MLMALVAPHPLLSIHQSHGDASFVDFGGAPLVHTFGEPHAEYAAIRKSCALFDAINRACFSLTGKDRHEFLGNLITNKTWDRATRAGLAAGTGTRAFLLNLKGRVVADLTLIERGEELLIEVDRRLVPMLIDVLGRYLFTEKVAFADRSTTHARLSLFGPGAAAVLADAGGVDVATLVNYGSLEATLFGVRTRIWREDLTASPGLHLLIEREKIVAVWQGLLDAFADVGKESNKRRLRPVGWAAFNTARIEAGEPILGIDYEPAAPSVPGRKKDDAAEEPGAKGILPAETGLFDRAVDVTKGCYLGQEIVARMFARKVVARRIVGFKMSVDALPVAGATVVDSTGADVGIVTSSTVSPVLSSACIGLALVKRPHFEVGTALAIHAEGSAQPAIVVELPFV